MRKFRIGDNVVVVADVDGIRGWIGVVMAKDMTCYLVDFAGTELWLDEEEIEASK